MLAAGILHPLRAASLKLAGPDRSRRLNCLRPRYLLLVPLPILGMKIDAACFEASPCGSNLIWAEQRQSRTSTGAHVPGISWPIIIPRPSISNGKGEALL
jgi:hypothetical protein